MPDDIRIRIETEADTSGIDELSDAYDRLEQETEAIADQAATQSDAYAKMQAEMDAAFDTMTSGAEKAKGGVDQLTQEANELDQALNDANAEMGETDMSVEEMARGFDDLVAQFKRVNKSSISLKGTWKSLRDEGAPAEELAELSSRISESERKEYELIAATKAMIRDLRAAGATSDTLGLDLNELSVRLETAEGHIDGVSRAAKKKINAMHGLGTAVDQVGDEVKNAGNKIDEAGKKIDHVGDRVEAGTGKITKSLKAVGAGIGILVIDKLQEAAYRITDFVKTSVEEFANLDSGIRQAATMSGIFAGDIDGLRRRTQDLNILLNRTSEETLPALYQGLSLGISEENLIDDITTASNAARAGAEELEETLVTGQSIVNAYGEDVYSLEEVYDILFATVKTGAVTITDLNRGMSEITSVAGEVNVPLEDIAAAITIMTKQGDDFSEAAGLMSNMLTQLQIEGTALGGVFKDAAGIGFREFIAEGGSLAEALQIIEEHARDTGDSLAGMIGGDSSFYRDQQAMRGVLEITGKHMDEFLAQTEYMYTEAAGSTDEANAIMAESTEESTKRMSVAWSQVKEGIGEFVADTLHGAEVMEFVANAMTGAVDIQAVQTRESVESLAEQATGLSELREMILDTYGEDAIVAIDNYGTEIVTIGGMQRNLNDVWVESRTTANEFSSTLNELGRQARELGPILRNAPLIDADIKVGWHGVIADQAEEQQIARELQARIQQALDDEDFQAAIDLMVEAGDIEFEGIEDSVVANARATGALQLQLAGEAALTMTVRDIHWEGYEEAVSAAFDEDAFGRVLEEKLTGNYELPEVQVPLDVDTSQVDNLTNTLSLSDEELGTLEYAPEVDSSAVDTLKETTSNIVTDVEEIGGDHQSQLHTNYNSESQKLGGILAKLQAIVAGDWSTTLDVDTGNGAPAGTPGGGPDGIGLATGTPGWMQIPKGYPNDSYGPVWLSEDEWVNVMPAGSNPLGAGGITNMPKPVQAPAPAGGSQHTTINATMPVYASSVLNHPSTFAARTMSVFDDLARQMH